MFYLVRVVDKSSQETNNSQYDHYCPKSPPILTFWEPEVAEPMCTGPQTEARIKLSKDIFRLSKLNPVKFAISSI